MLLPLDFVTEINVDLILFMFDSWKKFEYMCKSRWIHSKTGAFKSAWSQNEQTLSVEFQKDRSDRKKFSRCQVQPALIIHSLFKYLMIIWSRQVQTLAQVFTEWHTWAGTSSPGRGHWGVGSYHWCGLFWSGSCGSKSGWTSLSFEVKIFRIEIIPILCANTVTFEIEVRVVQTFWTVHPYCAASQPKCLWPSLAILTMSNRQ